MKIKKIYKAIACVSVWLAVVLAFVGLACFNSSKVNAGVIIETTLQEATGVYEVPQNAGYYRRIPQPISTSVSEQLGSITYGVPNPWTNRLCSINFTKLNMEFSHATLTVNIMNLGSTLGLTGGQIIVNYIKGNENNDYSYIAVDDIINAVRDLGNNAQIIDNYGNDTLYFRGSINTFFTSQNVISSVDNIYDLQQGDAAIIYISDVSGFDSANYQPEITMNWGYIDSTDNTVYAVYAPTINVMKAPGDLEIWLNIPTDASGTVYDSVILNQQALLTTITEGGATANANIYALYVWLLSDRIQWGLLNFNTAGLPASAMSMNYFTSYTTKYDYINTNTGTMTCRLSISNNFNFITIKNQPVFSVNTINTTLRQGGLLPAWALYNWARGSAAGFTSGTQAGAAPYQPGNTGYNEIYQAGYSAGLSAQPAAAWYEAAFNAVDDFLNIHIFPNITFGELFGIPFVISVVWFIIRSFRGGGSNG